MGSQCSQCIHIYRVKSQVFLCFDINPGTKILANSLVCHSVDSESGEFYYFNFATGETQWEHPLDELYRLKVRF